MLVFILYFPTQIFLSPNKNVSTRSDSHDDLPLIAYPSQSCQGDRVDPAWDDFYDTQGHRVSLTRVACRP